MFVPTVETVIDEETFLTDTPLNLLKAGKFLQIPFMIGMNLDDGLVLSNRMWKYYYEYIHTSLENDLPNL